MVYQPGRAQLCSFSVEKDKLITMSNCLQPLVKETTLLAKVGCEFSCHLSPCSSRVLGGQGGRQSVPRQELAMGAQALLLPTACCSLYHQRAAICFKEIGKAFVKPVTQPIMVEGCIKAWLRPGPGCIISVPFGESASETTK